MKTAGLQVVTLDAKALAEFRSAAENLGGDPARQDDSRPTSTTLAVREREAFR